MAESLPEENQQHAVEEEAPPPSTVVETPVAAVEAPHAVVTNPAPAPPQAPAPPPAPVPAPPVVQAPPPLAYALPAPVAPAAITPHARDVILGETSCSTAYKTNLLLQDLVRLHRTLWKLQDKKPPEQEEDLDHVATRIVQLIKCGKPLELAGLKDVPKPFMKSTGRFILKNGDEWKLLSDNDATQIMRKALFDEFKLEDLGNLGDSPYKELKEKFLNKTTGEEPAPTVPAPTLPEAKDAILIRCSPDFSREKLYEQQSGNKAMFNLASQLVTSYTSTPDKRVEAALAIMKGLDETDVYDEETGVKHTSTQKYARFLLRTTKDDDSITWSVVDPDVAAEFTLVFVFEVFLEKEIHSIVGGFGSASLETSEADVVPPSTEPVEEPTDHDVLFGRGGMTNSHPGNRRFRDIIALHRPDYIRATKVDKPAVARKIVKAIRVGAPPGRFLKKNDDGKWYDVGDRTAAEKTSQGLRERSNAEKRQRSALREALRIRKQDMSDSDNSPVKKPKLADPTGITAMELSAAALSPTLNYNLATVPLSLSMKDQQQKPPEKKPGEEETREVNLGEYGDLQTEGLPPNAVDAEGNILVTDYDILCGRGGLTNHHKGNKRFRDIVALHRPDYVRAPKIQKPSVARVIVRAIRNGDPPGRFLKKDEKTGKWIDIGDKKAAEKTSQALREKTNEERDKLKREPGALTAGVLLPNPAAYLAPVSGSPFLQPQIAPIVVGELKEEGAANGTALAEAKGESGTDPVAAPIPVSVPVPLPVAADLNTQRPQEEANEIKPDVDNERTDVKEEKNDEMVTQTEIV